MPLRRGKLVKNEYGQWKWKPEESPIESLPPAGAKKVENIYVEDGKVKVEFEDET